MSNSTMREAAYFLYSRAVGALPDRLAIALHFRVRTGYWPNLDEPSTFNEKIQSRKLFGDQELYARLADKVLVKDYVQQSIGSEFVIPTLWTGKALPPIGKRDWPVPCVLKCNHGSGGNAFLRTTDDLCAPDLTGRASRWMKTSFAPHLKERFYDRIDRLLLVEPMIGDSLDDYKFYVFGGRVEYIHVDTDRFTLHKRRFYDREWNHVPMSLRFPMEHRELRRPANLDKMIWAAEMLARDLDFARVDFYDLPSGPKFGEITFTPGGGCERFQPQSFDHQLGKLWRQCVARA